MKIQKYFFSLKLGKKARDTPNLSLNFGRKNVFFIVLVITIEINREILKEIENDSC